MAAQALFGLLRLATNRRVLQSPLPVDQAISHVRHWLGRPNVGFLAPGPAHVEIALQLWECSAAAPRALMIISQPAARSVARAAAVLAGKSG